MFLDKLQISFAYRRHSLNIAIKRQHEIYNRATLFYTSRKLFLSSIWSTLNADEKQRPNLFEKRLIRFSPQQLYQVVSDVDRYKEFVPHCKDSIVVQRFPTENKLRAELVIGFLTAEQRYTSLVTLNPYHSVQVCATETDVFHYLNSSWTFDAGPSEKSCWTTFEISYLFKSELHRGLADLFFQDVHAKTLHAFEERCRTLYEPELKHEKPYQ